MSGEPLQVGTGGSSVSAELLAPAEPRAVLVLAHGAGAGFGHPNMVAIGDALAAVGVASLRFNFPFMEAGRRQVDSRPVAMAAVADAVRTAAARLPGTALCVGGHSFGGRMASHALAAGLMDARALICMSFPLHPANRPGIERAAHLADVPAPMLFLSGTRDTLADADLLAGVVDDLGPRATLHWLEDADHGYKTRKKVRTDPRSVFDEMADAVAEFLTILD